MKTDEFKRLNAIGNTDGDETDGKPPSEHPEPTLPTFDRILELLTNERRRRTLKLVDTHGQLELEQLTEKIAISESQGVTDAAQLNHRQRKRAYTGLYQSHLPKLTSHNVIRWGRKPNDTIRPGPHLPPLVAMLDAIEAVDDVCRGTATTDDSDESTIATLVDRLEEVSE